MTVLTRCDCNCEYEQSSDFTIFSMETQSIISNINRFTINLRLVVVTVTIDTCHKALFLFL